MNDTLTMPLQIMKFYVYFLVLIFTQRSTNAQQAVSEAKTGTKIATFDEQMVINVLKAQNRDGSWGKVSRIVTTSSVANALVSFASNHEYKHRAIIDAYQRAIGYVSSRSIKLKSSEYYAVLVLKMNATGTFGPDYAGVPITYAENSTPKDLETRFHEIMLALQLSEDERNQSFKDSISKDGG